MKTRKGLFCIFVGLTIFLGTSSQAVTVLDLEKKIKATDGIGAWIKEIKGVLFGTAETTGILYGTKTENGKTETISGAGSYFTSGTGYTQCREVEEQPGAILCASLETEDMNRMFTRISLHSEGGFDFKEGDYIKKKTPQLNFGVLLIGGHDIRSQKFDSFFKGARKRCNRGQFQFCLNDHERDFYKNVYLPLKKRGTDYAIVTFAIKTDQTYNSVVSHEILHSHYFLNEQYRNIVQTFWDNNVTDEDHNLFKTRIGAVYDTSNHYVLLNEFQAYVLQTTGKNYAGQDLSDKYKPTLMESLKQAGFNPIQVQ